MLISWGALQYFYSPNKRRKSALLYKVFFSVFLIHFFLEGYRWQMLPAYFLGVILIVLYQKWMSITIKTAMVVWLMLAATLPIVVPIIKMPKLTGQYPIGSTAHHWVDKERKEWFTDDPSDVRQIMVQLWYPALKMKKLKMTPYIDNIDIRSKPLLRPENFQNN